MYKKLFKFVPLLMIPVFLTGCGKVNSIETFENSVNNFNNINSVSVTSQLDLSMEGDIPFEVSLERIDLSNKSSNGILRSFEIELVSDRDELNNYLADIHFIDIVNSKKYIKDSVTEEIIFTELKNSEDISYVISHFINNGVLVNSENAEETNGYYVIPCKVTFDTFKTFISGISFKNEELGQSLLNINDSNLSSLEFYLDVYVHKESLLPSKLIIDVHSFNNFSNVLKNYLVDTNFSKSLKEKYNLDLKVYQLNLTKTEILLEKFNELPDVTLPDYFNTATENKIDIKLLDKLFKISGKEIPEEEFPEVGEVSKEEIPEIEEIPEEEIPEVEETSEEEIPEEELSEIEEIPEEELPEREEIPEVEETSEEEFLGEENSDIEKLLEDAKTDENGNIVLSDGRIIRPDGEIHMSDGTIIYPDGKIIVPDGVVGYYDEDGNFVEKTSEEISEVDVILEEELDEEEISDKGFEDIFNNLGFYINDTFLEMSLTCKDFIEKGYNIDKSLREEMLEPGKYSVPIKHSFGKNYFTVVYMNNSKEELSLLDCPVLYIELDSLFIEDSVNITTEKIVLNDSLDVLIEKLGTPSYKYAGTNTYVYTYELDNTHYVVFQIDKKTNSICYSKLFSINL